MKARRECAADEVTGRRHMVRSMIGYELVERVSGGETCVSVYEDLNIRNSSSLAQRAYPLFDAAMTCAKFAGALVPLMDEGGMIDEVRDLHSNARERALLLVERWIGGKPNEKGH